jgi:hypothetical protein
MRGTGTCRAASTDFSPEAEILKATPKPPFFGKLIEPLHQIADFENGHSDR